MFRSYSRECVLRVGVLGINFKIASLEVREAIARAAEGLYRACLKLEHFENPQGYSNLTERSLFGEKKLFFSHPTILLSTCNRTEIYFAGDDLASIHSDLLAVLRQYTQERFEHRLYSYFGIDCFLHLCRVAAGLDSAILAETEIQRQVKVAYLQAAEKSILPSGMHYIFQKALKVGKMVRNQIDPTRGAPSLHSTIFQLARTFFGICGLQKVLLVGYSELNRGLASFLLRKGMTHLTFCTQKPDSVHYLGCNVIGREVLEMWDGFDLIICASKAGNYLIRRPSTFRRLIFDLSVPRNVDPKMGQISQLYNMEQINNLIETSGRAQQAGFTQCEAFVKQYVIRLARIYREKQVTPYSLEIGVAGISGKRDYIPDIFHACHEENEALKS
jgi:glutamyl-tRNA reductase